MKRFSMTLMASMFALATGVPAWADGSVSGKFSAYASVSGVTIGIDTIVATATILKGKKKRALEVEGTIVESGTNSLTALGALGDVNGIPLEPIGAFAQVQETCGPSIVNCTVTGVWWLDLDAAELANPGLFINQPLVVTLKSSTGGGSGNGVASLRARMVKK